MVARDVTIVRTVRIRTSVTPRNALETKAAKERNNVPTRRLNKRP